MIQCYNCGKYFDKKETNKEHIPAQGLYQGYDAIYKNNRITVRSCVNCNSSYSKDDEEFRNMVGIMNSAAERKMLSEKSAKSIIKINKEYNRIRTDLFGNIVGVEFNQSNIHSFHVKNFRGLYYHEYKVAISDDYSIVSLPEPTEKTYHLIHYLVDNFKWKISGHRDVFGYIIQPLREIKEQLIDLKPDETDKVILACMDYNNSHTALVVAIKHEK
jgi:hypothetical protein